MEKTKVAIIGSGPSGFTAAIYASRAQLAPTQFTGVKSGGQLMWTTEVENFPGFPEGIDGPQLMVQMRQQAERFGTTMVDSFVTAVDLSQRPFKLWTNFPEGQDITAYEGAKPEEVKALQEQIMQQPHAYEAETIIISSGATAKMLGVPGEKEFLGRGLSTCAVCDAAFYKEKNTFVVGGGDAAMEDTLALTKFAKSVTVLHRRDAFRASKIMQDRVLNNPKVKVLWNTTLDEVIGEQQVKEIKITTDGAQSTLPADGVFVAIGHHPVTQIFSGQIQLDDHGYVVTRQSFDKHGLERAQQALTENGLVPFPTMTSVDGVFAAGDVVDIRYKQAVTAAAQGCQAALDAEWYLERGAV